MVNTVLRKYTDKERERYLEEYQNSDLTVSQFARENGIPASTLKGLLNKETDIRSGEVQTEESEKEMLRYPITSIIIKISVIINYLIINDYYIFIVPKGSKNFA